MKPSSIVLLALFLSSCATPVPEKPDPVPPSSLYERFQHLKDSE